MPGHKLIEDMKLQDLQQYDFEEAARNAICFIGTPFKNPSRKDKVVLTPSAFGLNKVFYEFDVKDVVKWEEIDKIVDNKGNTLPVIKLYIKKNSNALKYEPFRVK